MIPNRATVPSNAVTHRSHAWGHSEESAVGWLAEGDGEFERLVAGCLRDTVNAQGDRVDARWLERASRRIVSGVRAKAGVTEIAPLPWRTAVEPPPELSRGSLSALGQAIERLFGWTPPSPSDAALFLRVADVADGSRRRKNWHRDKGRTLQHMQGLYDSMRRLETQLRGAEEEVRRARRALTVAEAHRDGCRRAAEEAVRLRGLAPGQLQRKWRSDPPAEYDPKEATDAILDALNQDGVVAEKGEGVARVEEIVRAQWERWRAVKESSQG
jgi:hypothetical protein